MSAHDVATVIEALAVLAYPLALLVGILMVAREIRRQDRDA